MSEESAILSLEQCREILGPDAPVTEEELEAARDLAFQIARVVVTTYSKTRRRRTEGTA